MTVSRGQKWLDSAAIGASGLCVIHCLVLPVLIVLLPSLTAFLAVPEPFHVWAVAFAVPTSIAALLAGYRRHRRARPTRFVVPGLLLLSAGAFAALSEDWETVLTVIGAVLLAIGHALNWRAMHPSQLRPAPRQSV